MHSFVYNVLQFFLFLGFDFCRFCVVIRFFPSPPQRPMTSDFAGFLYQILSITSFSYLNSWERASISLFNIEFYFYNGPWLGIEPVTYRTRYKHSTTRLSRRRFFFNEYSVLYREISLPTPPLKLWKHAFKLFV